MLAKMGGGLGTSQEVRDALQGSHTVPTGHGRGSRGSRAWNPKDAFGRSQTALGQVIERGREKGKIG